MIAVLSKLLGLQNLQFANDIVQDTLMQALQSWPLNGIPSQPSAWLYRVAKNRAIDFLRREKRYRGIRAIHAHLIEREHIETIVESSFFDEGEIEDSQLRMLFACCHPQIPIESQLPLALKTLCGLSVSEIAHSFLKDEETIAKRIYRAKEKIRTKNIQLELPPPAFLPERLDAVLHCLYLLFNEGYNSTHPQELIREDFCYEAIRMLYLLTKQPLTNLPTTNAVLALFCFQASRLKARLCNDGNIILLKYQDRSKWFQPLIQQGFFFMEKATVQESSVYHLEAAIAYMHAKAPNFEATDWNGIYTLYTILAGQDPNPFIALNKAIASSYAISNEEAMKQLKSIQGLKNYSHYQTAMGELYLDLNLKTEAKKHYTRAYELSKTTPEKQLLEDKIKACELP